MSRPDALRAEEWRTIRREIAAWHAGPNPERERVEVRMHNGIVLVSTETTKTVKAVKA